MLLVKTLTIICNLTEITIIFYWASDIQKQNTSFFNEMRDVYFTPHCKDLIVIETEYPAMRNTYTG